MSAPTRPFNARMFVNLMLLLAGLGLPVTGIVNHCLGFASLTPQRHGWMAAHNALGVLFVAFAVGHAWLNRRPLLGQIKAMGASAAALRNEVLLAGLILLLATLFAAHGFLVGA